MGARREPRAGNPGGSVVRRDARNGVVREVAAMSATTATRPAGYTPVVRPQPAPASIPFRIRIGVTGAREIPESEVLAAKVREVLDVQVLRLFDDESRTALAAAPHTPVAFSIVTS